MIQAHQPIATASQATDGRGQLTRTGTRPGDDDEWLAKAYCRGRPADLFFPTDSGGVVEAQRVCLRCSVRQECLAYAIEHGIWFGVWGGKSERARKKIARERGRHV